jgi:hypothetical protein
MSNINLHNALEIMCEVAWQMGDKDFSIDRASNRHCLVEISQKIINTGLINEGTTDIDESISNYLSKENQ